MKIIFNILCVYFFTLSLSAQTGIKGFDLLEKVTGHWVGNNGTKFGFYDFFVFDFRPISPSHTHSIYEGATQQNIITSVFIADYEGKLQVMARNGGWLFGQYRATYYVLDEVEEREDHNYYRLVDAIGREKRSYMTFRFKGDSLFFDAYKDKSGKYDDPVHHMEFKGANLNPEYSIKAKEHFSFPQPVAEVNLTGKFEDLTDNDSATFLEEKDDPFSKKDHGYISDLTITIKRNVAARGQRMLMYISTKQLLDEKGNVNYTNLERSIIRTIDIEVEENSYTATYLHPDTYYVTVFTDEDGNFYPSKGDVVGVAEKIIVAPMSRSKTLVNVNIPLH